MPCLSKQVLDAIARKVKCMSSDSAGYARSQLIRSPSKLHFHTIQHVTKLLALRTLVMETAAKRTQRLPFFMARGITAN